MHAAYVKALTINNVSCVHCTHIGNLLYILVIRPFPYIQSVVIAFGYRVQWHWIFFPQLSSFVNKSVPMLASGVKLRQIVLSNAHIIRKTARVYYYIKRPTAEIEGILIKHVQLCTHACSTLFPKANSIMKER